MFLLAGGYGDGLCGEVFVMQRVEIIQIWFENCEYLEIGIEDFEWIRIDKVCSCYHKFSGSPKLIEEFQACGEVSFQLKADTKNVKWLLWGGSSNLPEGMSPHDGAFFRLQECMDITQLVLCYDDGSKKAIWTPYENKYSGGEESWLESAELDSEGGLTVTILPERKRDE